MLRITHILCPIDFSEYSRHAFDRAVAVARAYHATVAVLHVYAVPTAVAAVPFGPEGPGPFALHSFDRERLLADMPRFLSLEADIGVPVHFEVLEAPSVHKEIVRQAHRLSADLLVMGTHGRSGFERLLLGSVTEKVLRTSHVPVLTVPAHAPDVLPIARDPFRRVLCATDFSSGAQAALRYAASLAQHAAAPLTILHVVEVAQAGYDPIVLAPVTADIYDAEVEAAARAALRDAVPEAVRLGCDTIDVEANGKPYAEILRVAAEQQADVIVLGVHGRNAMDRLVFGSTTEQVVRRATCPVMTVREPEAVTTTGAKPA